eukprot:scaffold108043_cov54-Phaeocystis_antarctica.AAC.1
MVREERTPGSTRSLRASKQRSVGTEPSPVTEPQLEKTIALDGSPGVGARPRVARVGEDVVGAARAVPKREVRRHVLARAPVDLLRAGVSVRVGVRVRVRVRGSRPPGCPTSRGSPMWARRSSARGSGRPG